MVKSPIKIIDSGTAPTTANLGEGQIAFGTVDGATKLYGSDGTTVTDLTTSGGQGPQGPQGEPGAPGAAATVTVGTTTTGEAGTEAAVTNSGSTSAAVLNFTIPKGAKGDKGEKGDTGSTGPAGTTTFAGLTDQPTDNAALKTALDAKADQTTVDSLAATVNGMFAVPDYANAVATNFPIDYTVPSNGFVHFMPSNSPGVMLAPSVGVPAFTVKRGDVTSNPIACEGNVLFPVRSGDVLTAHETYSGTAQRMVFYPLYSGGTDA